MQLNELREHPWMKRDVASDNEVIQFMQNFNWTVISNLYKYTIFKFSIIYHIS